MPVSIAVQHSTADLLLRPLAAAAAALLCSASPLDARCSSVTVVVAGASVGSSPVACVCVCFLVLLTDAPPHSDLLSTRPPANATPVHLPLCSAQPTTPPAVPARPCPCGVSQQQHSRHRRCHCRLPLVSLSAVSLLSSRRWRKFARPRAAHRPAQNTQMTTTTVRDTTAGARTKRSGDMTARRDGRRERFARRLCSAPARSSKQGRMQAWLFRNTAAVPLTRASSRAAPAHPRRARVPIRVLKCRPLLTRLCTCLRARSLALSLDSVVLLAKR